MTPDFKKKPGALDIVLDAGPAVFAHNVETVPRLYKSARPGSSYDGLGRAAARRPRRAATARASPLRVKTSIIAGLGEEDAEILEVMRDCAAPGSTSSRSGSTCSRRREHLPVARWVHPDTFAMFRDEGLAMGFLHVESGPLVRSSYHAERHRPDPVPPNAETSESKRGAGNGTRTRDLDLGKVALYQLSYSRHEAMAPRQGGEDSERTEVRQSPGRNASRDVRDAPSDPIRDDLDDVETAGCSSQPDLARKTEATRAIRARFRAVTASAGRPKPSLVRVFTSTKTSDRRRPAR